MPLFTHLPFSSWCCIPDKYSSHLIVIYFAGWSWELWFFFRGRFLVPHVSIHYIESNHCYFSRNCVLFWGRPQRVMSLLASLSGRAFARTVVAITSTNVASSPVSSLGAGVTIYLESKRYVSRRRAKERAASMLFALVSIYLDLNCSVEKNTIIQRDVTGKPIVPTKERPPPVSSVSLFCYDCMKYWEEYTLMFPMNSCSPGFRQTAYMIQYLRSRLLRSLSFQSFQLWVIYLNLDGWLTLPTGLVIFRVI